MRLGEVIDGWVVVKVWWTEKADPPVDSFLLAKIPAGESVESMGRTWHNTEVEHRIVREPCQHLWIPSGPKEFPK